MCGYLSIYKYFFGRLEYVMSVVMLNFSKIQQLLVDLDVEQRKMWQQFFVLSLSLSETYFFNFSMGNNWRSLWKSETMEYHRISQNMLEFHLFMQEYHRIPHNFCNLFQNIVEYHLF